LIVLNLKFNHYTAILIIIMQNDIGSGSRVDEGILEPAAEIINKV